MTELFVYKCIKNQGTENWGLGSKKYKKGNYISYEGDPVKKLEEAYIFKKEIYSIEDVEDWFKYFKLVKVKVSEA